MLPLSLPRFRVHGRASVSSGIRRVLLASLLVVVGWFSGTMPARAQSISPLLPAQQRRRVEIKRYRPNGTVPESTPTCSSPLLSYFDGPLISNVQVVPVFWNSNVNASIQANISQFYSDAAVSNWYDLLSEYSSVGGTGQSIGRGTSATGIVITPSVCPASTPMTCPLTDSQLQTELANQITNGNLPTLQTDLAGNVNTVYMVYFPSNISLTLPGDIKSCVNFCAYHSTGTYGSDKVPMPYGAIMDEFTGSCSGTACGGYLNRSGKYHKHCFP